MNRPSKHVASAAGGAPIPNLGADDRARADFAGTDQATREHWRSIVLFGRNVASYKFALAKSLIEIGRDEREFVALEELSEPFARHICEHLARVDRQGTFAHSKFLDACRYYNAGTINADELRTATARLGFANVMDAFHVVGGDEVPTRFFIDERAQRGGIRLTDEVMGMAGSVNGVDLMAEAESRWRLVEEAWDARAEGDQVIVLYDAPRELLVPALIGKRRSITEVRPALNGYQKGYCFYCFAPIRAIASEEGPAADVDHFLPHTLMARGIPVDLDAPWNLVLACTACNRGPAGKHAATPDARYLERLHTRNEYLIASNHPLKETLIVTTGDRPASRRRFLLEATEVATALTGARAGWATIEQGPSRF